MKFAIILAIAAALSFALRNPLKRFPMLFYAAAIALNALFIVGLFVELPRMLWEVTFLLMQKCTLALALFVVVMFVGVLPKDSRVACWLRPVRGELSIVAWILSLGHMAVYLATYVPRLLAGSAVEGNVIAAFVVALTLFALLLVLGATSFQAVKRRMSAESWRRVQKLAYLFYALVYAHLMIMLMPAASMGGEQAILNVTVYSMVFVAYVVLRLLRAGKGRQDEECDGTNPLGAAF